MIKQYSKQIISIVITARPQPCKEKMFYPDTDGGLYQEIPITDRFIRESAGRSYLYL